MTDFVSSRRRMIQRKGRVMQLGRQVGVGDAGRESVTLKGFFSVFAPDQLAEGGLQQGDGRVAITADEIAVAGWPGPPRAGDEMDFDGGVWAVVGVESVFDADALAGFNLTLRGA